MKPNILLDFLFAPFLKGGGPLTIRRKILWGGGLVMGLVSIATAYDATTKYMVPPETRAFVGCLALYVFAGFVYSDATSGLRVRL